MSYKDRLLRDIFTKHSAGQLKPGGVTIVQVRHDNWCAIFKGGECNCHPLMNYETVDPEEEDGCPNDPP